MKKETVLFDWLEIKKDFPKSFGRVTSWAKNNRLKGYKFGENMKLFKYTPNNYCFLPTINNWTDLFFTDILEREIDKSKKDIGKYFNELEIKINQKL